MHAHVAYESAICCDSRLKSRVQGMARQCIGPLEDVLYSCTALLFFMADVLWRGEKPIAGGDMLLSDACPTRVSCDALSGQSFS